MLLGVPSQCLHAENAPGLKSLFRKLISGLAAPVWINERPIYGKDGVGENKTRGRAPPLPRECPDEPEIRKRQSEPRGLDRVCLKRVQLGLS